MKLLEVTIRNFRSINELTIAINPIEDNSFTYGLIGINEAGKSSILRAMSFKDNFDSFVPTIKDFNNKEKPIEVSYKFEMDSKEIKLAKEHLKIRITNVDISKIDIAEVSFNITVQYTTPNTFSKTVTCHNVWDDDSLKSQVESQLVDYFTVEKFKTIFWKAEDKYLISRPIAIAEFAVNPNISIPLRNCFYLTGIEDIKGSIALLSDSTEKEYLEEKLGKKVTEHIKNVWKGHPIKITFKISDGVINFHVKDENAIGRAKTADQRSDGFKQFISFLLTISAENKNNVLENTLLLLDEPEIHLHPKAQEDLLNELVKITKSKKNNVAFFATHSNYLIDKNYLNRNFKIEKPEETTILSTFEKKLSTYASVNYDVFDIESTDYHNELYGRAQELCDIINGTEFDKKIKEINSKVPIKKDYIDKKGKKFDCTLPTYIRHQIHHPENKNNDRFTPDELKRSINILLLMVDKIKTEEKS